jgi:hypothetical protein
MIVVVVVRSSVVALSVIRPVGALAWRRQAMIAKPARFGRRTSSTSFRCLVTAPFAHIAHLGRVLRPNGRQSSRLKATQFHAPHGPAARHLCVCACANVETIGLHSNTTQDCSVFSCNLQVGKFCGPLRSPMLLPPLAGLQASVRPARPFLSVCVCVRSFVR